MIKFRMHSKISEEERRKFGEVLRKCQNYRFFDIFLHILHKMKENLGQELVKRRLLSFQEKDWNNFPCYPWKNVSFSSFVPTFPPLPP